MEESCTAGVMLELQHVHSSVGCVGVKGLGGGLQTIWAVVLTNRGNRPAVTGSCTVLGLCVWDLVTGSVVVFGRLDRHVVYWHDASTPCVASTCSAALIAGSHSAMQQRHVWPGFGVGLVCWLSVCWSISVLYTLNAPLQQCVE
jgi:hypothetical protein